MSEYFYHGPEVIELNTGTRPIQTVKSSVIGAIGTAPDADPAVFPLNEPVLVLTHEKAAKLGTTGTLPDVWDDITDQGVKPWTIFVRVEEGADLAATTANLIGSSALKTGVHAFRAAQSILGVTPRILVATGFTSQRLNDSANPVVAEIDGIAKYLRAVQIVDGPGTTPEDALTYRNDWGSDRIYVVDPFVKVFDTKTAQTTLKPASARVAGLIAYTDWKKGFWHSPSNQSIGGITGVGRPVDFVLGDPNCEANFLNENEIATVINHDGYRLWGNRSTSSDSLWAFLSVRRTTDMVYESLENGLMPFVDMPMSAQNVLDVQETVNAYLRRLKSKGALLGGKCWFDPEKNEKETLKGGEITWSFDLEPPAPMEHMRFETQRNDGYYDELVSAVKG